MKVKQKVFGQFKNEDMMQYYVVNRSVMNSCIKKQTKYFYLFLKLLVCINLNSCEISNPKVTIKPTIFQIVLPKAILKKN